MDDRRIMQGLQNREEAALGALMRRYGALLRYILRPILEDEREVEECLSDIYAKLWDKCGSFDPEKGSLNAWLTVLARNTALDRARRYRRETSLEEVEEPVQESAEEAVLCRERQQMLLRAVRALTEKEQILFYRKYYYCQPSERIAAELGLSRRAVEGRLYRLREKLRRELGGDFFDG